MGVYTLRVYAPGVYILKVYSLGPPISDLEMHLHVGVDTLGVNTLGVYSLGLEVELHSSVGVCTQGF